MAIRFLWWLGAIAIVIAVSVFEPRLATALPLIIGFSLAVIGFAWMRRRPGIGRKAGASVFLMAIGYTAIALDSGRIDGLYALGNLVTMIGLVALWTGVLVLCGLIRKSSRNMY